MQNNGFERELLFGLNGEQYSEEPLEEGEESSFPQDPVKEGQVDPAKRLQEYLMTQLKLRRPEEAMSPQDALKMASMGRNMQADNNLASVFSKAGANFGRVNGEGPKSLLPEHMEKQNAVINERIGDLGASDKMTYMEDDRKRKLMEMLQKIKREKAQQERHNFFSAQDGTVLSGNTGTGEARVIGKFPKAQASKPEQVLRGMGGGFFVRDENGSLVEIGRDAPPPQQASLMLTPPNPHTGEVQAINSKTGETIKTFAGTTPQQVEEDKEMARAVQEQNKGGNVQTEANIRTLRDLGAELAAIDSHANSGFTAKNLTSGKVSGLIPEAVRNVINPRAREIQQRMNTITVQSLRPTLGAQFTADESLRFQALQYDPRVSERENARRALEKANILETMLKREKAAADYYRQNGSMRGYTPPDIPIPTLQMPPTPRQIEEGMPKVQPAPRPSKPIIRPEDSPQDKQAIQELMRRYPQQAPDEETARYILYMRKRNRGQ